MSDSLLIGLLISGGLSIFVLVGYAVARSSVRAGIAIVTAGVLLEVVLIVNYFEEVPVAIVASTLRRWRHLWYSLCLKLFARMPILSLVGFTSKTISSFIPPSNA